MTIESEKSTGVVPDAVVDDEGEVGASWYDAIFSKLSSLDPEKKDELKEAMTLAEAIKTVLLAEARQHTILGTSIELYANKLIEIMFNRFHTHEYDNLVQDLMKVSAPPTAPFGFDSTANT